jgi:hypothetical protein
MKKVCGFYVSNMHLVTIMLPYLKNKINHEIKIETFFEYNLDDNINKILNNLIISKEEKRKILNINWEKSRLRKYSNIEKSLKNIIENNEEINLLISGSEKYIKEVNNILNIFFEKYSAKINNKKITIINFYEVTEFNDNIRKILDEHEFILNTSGIHKMEEIFEDYKKRIAN